jgi:hypothetical protein
MSVGDVFRAAAVLDLVKDPHDVSLSLSRIKTGRRASSLLHAVDRPAAPGAESSATDCRTSARWDQVQCVGRPPRSQPQS